MQHTAHSEAMRFDGGDKRDGASALAAVVRRLSGARSEAEIMGIVTYGVRTLLQADGATFVLRDGDRCYYAEEDSISPLWKGRRFPMASCVSGWCMLHRAPAVIHDVYADPRVPVGAYRPTFVRSMVMAPVGLEEPIAALGAYWSVTRTIQPEEIELLQTIANAAALAVAYVQLQENGRPTKPKALPQPPPPAAAAERERSWLARLGERLRHDAFKPNTPAAYAFGAFCVAVAALLRWGVNAADPGVHAPFTTFYPATLFTLLVAGAEAAAFAGVIGGLIAYLAFMPPRFGFGPLTSTAEVNLGLYLAGTGLMIWMVERYRRAVRRLMEEDARLITLAREQNHRMQNAIGVVESIVRQSLRGDRLLARSINQRIRAGLAEIDIQPRGGAKAAPLGAVLSEQLEAFDLSRFRLDGDDDIAVAAEVCTLVALAAHELATNAVKYGALTTPDGCVEVEWRAAGGRVTVCWRELGGPPVEPTTERGYGSILLNRLITAANGSFTRNFTPEGVAVEISLPLAPAHQNMSLGAKPAH
jgi:two-component sensor histidine kinase